MWQRGSKGGLRFVQVEEDERKIMREATEKHYLFCDLLAKKYHHAYPDQPLAAANLWQAQFHNASSQRERHEVVVAARNQARGQKNGEYWLGIAKLTMLYGKSDLAQSSLERAASLMPRDGRVRELQHLMRVQDEENSEQSVTGLRRIVTGVFNVFSKDGSKTSD